MKRTPISIARAVGNRKVNFALIERRRGNALGNVTETFRHEKSRYVTRDSQRQILPAANIANGSDQALKSHLISDTAKESKMKVAELDDGR